MSKIMEDRITEKKISIAYNFLLPGNDSKEDIANAVKLPLESINELEAITSAIIYR